MLTVWVGGACARRLNAHVVQVLIVVFFASTGILRICAIILGNLNLSSRSIVCLPSCLYEIHLGITPKPLEAVTEPDYAAESTPKRSRANKQQPSWYEAQDLTVLKARSNEITAIQPEIALFGSLKVVDVSNTFLSWTVS